MPELELDAFDPRLECGAWAKAPRVIGGPSHTHVCRLEAGHTREGAEAYVHACGCGQVW